MTAKQKYWIADPSGTHALVEGVDERDLWTRVRGWHVADEPSGDTQTRVVNGELLGCIPFVALEAGWADNGWEPGPPPVPADVYRDPAPVEVAAPVFDEPDPQTKPADGGKSKES